MERGYLIVNVTYAGMRIPIENARVSFFPRAYEASGEYDEQVAADVIAYGNYSSRRRTDASGKTDAILIEAPQISLSYIENGGDVPYSVCDVLVEKEGFFSSVYFGVQIFPERESVLPAVLTPYDSALADREEVQSGFSPFASLVYTIPKPIVRNGGGGGNVLYKYPDSVEAELLLAPYIPDQITVHLGRPSQNAQNVSLSFREYIKNVASSEIYPTWPDNTIRANVYAQISIALNRIYTEWYPSQGYDFQITNSTAFDQAFVNGRNIYSNIGQIVDEVFNTYISRIGFDEPLFATYCDGNRTTCDGMSQWGSYALGDAGYTPIEILRRYYGENIELVSTDDIRGIESTYGGVPLAFGQIGHDVTVIQSQLNRIREDYPAIPRINTVDGIFGTDTDAAVRAFQRIFDLTVDGVVGKATWYKISFVYVSVKRLGELASEGQQAQLLTLDTSVILREGDSGGQVSSLQYLLEFISLYYSTVSSLSIDGKFGAGTRNSLIGFQRTFGFPETGTTTEETWDALLSVYETIIGISFPIESNQYFTDDLSYGSRGESVLLMQRYINVISEYFEGVSPLDEDGIFGSRTEEIVREIQRRLVVDPTGVIDSVTWYRIVELYNYIIRTSGQQNR